MDEYREREVQTEQERELKKIARKKNEKKTSDAKYLILGGGLPAGLMGRQSQGLTGLFPDGS